MPISDIQATALLAATSRNELIHNIFIRPFDVLCVDRDQGGAITTATMPLSLDFRLILMLVFFGKAQDAPLEETTSLDRGDTILVKVMLSKRADCQEDCRATSLYEETIDLADKNPGDYFPADASFARPYRHHSVQVNYPGLSFPDYGEYTVKILLMRKGIDDDFFIQSISPLTVQPWQNKSSTQAN